jgi:hypothetical protein
MIIELVAKSANEIAPHTVDLTKILAAGETIATAIVTSRDGATGVDTSSAFLVGDAIVLSPYVTKTFQNGAGGKTHVVTYAIVTSLGNHYDPELEVLVVA